MSPCQVCGVETTHDQFLDWNASGDVTKDLRICSICGHYDDRSPASNR